MLHVALEKSIPHSFSVLCNILKIEWAEKVKMVRFWRKIEMKLSNELLSVHP